MRHVLTAMIMPEDQALGDVLPTGPKGGADPLAARVQGFKAGPLLGGVHAHTLCRGHDPPRYKWPPAPPDACTSPSYPSPTSYGSVRGCSSHHGLAVHAGAPAAWGPAAGGPASGPTPRAAPCGDRHAASVPTPGRTLP